MVTFDGARATCAVMLTVTLAAIGACTTEPPSGEGPHAIPARGQTTPTYWKDIEPLVSSKCLGCHKHEGIAPFSLTTPEEVVAHKEEMKAATGARSMPPWPPAADCTKYRYDRSLSDAQIALVRDWVDGGAPIGDPGSLKNQVAPPDGSLSRVDRTLPIQTPYTPNGTDDYRCFLVDWPETTTKFITGFGVKPGIPRIVHHVIVYLATPQTLPEYQALDAQDATPGWECFGGPSAKSQPRWVGAWAPGSLGKDTPPGTGLEIPSGSKLVVQVHYNTHGGPPAADQTSLVVSLADQVEKKAFVMPWTSLEWLQGGMNIPPRSKDVDYSFSFDPTTVADLVTDGGLPRNKPLTIYGAALHMHLHGTRSSIGIERANGSTDCMVDIPKWSFHWQDLYGFDTPKILSPGDKLKLSCRYDNATDKALAWGERTEDEMCLGTMFVTE